MTTTTTPAIDALVAKFDARLKDLADERTRLEDARAALLTGNRASAPRPVPASPVSHSKPPTRRRRSGRAKRGEVPAVILKLLSDGKVRMPAQIAVETGLSNAQVSNAVTRLIASGHAVRPKEGRGWTVPDSPNAG